MNPQAALEHRAQVEAFQRKHRTGLLTLMFTDLVGSTRLKQELGDSRADGETTVRINQQEPPPHGRLFRTLGTFRFQAGRTGWVRISNDGTDGKYVIADAVQWLPVDGTKD